MTSKTSGTFTGTNITIGYDSATEKLTLTGYDTLANYQTVLNAVSFNSTGDNPTDYGLHNTRTITWQASDGAIDDPSGTNTTTTTLTIDAQNDAPNVFVGGGNSASMALTESNSGFNQSRSLSIADPDSLTETLTLTTFSHTGPVGGLSDATLQGYFSVPSTVSITQTTGTASFNWTFNSGAQAFDFLAVGETLTINYTIHDVDSNDSNGPGSASLSDDQAIQVTITGTNDAPTVTGGTTQGLAAIFEDTAPAGQTVSSLLGSHFADVDDNAALAAVAIVSNGTSASGKWQWSTLGSSWTDVGTASDASAVLVHAASFVRFLPATNFNGSAPALSVRLVDDTQTSFSDGATANVSTNGGTTPYSTGTVALNESVTAVNDAPAGTDVTKTFLEDGSYTFAAADFGFTDPADANAPSTSGANAFLSVIITTLPTAGAGTLTVSNVAVTAGQEIAVANIPNLKFTPTANANGSPEGSFTFQVRDDGGILNSGQDTDQSANTFTFNVTPVNDPPSGTNNAVTTNEDTAYTFTTADFGFSDPTDSPPNTLFAVKITTLPGSGTLTDNNVAVNAGDSIPVADITGGKLKFAPAADANGAPYTTFTFQVQDNGGILNGGIDLDPTPNVMTVNVNAVNDAPVVDLNGAGGGTGVTLAYNENDAATAIAPAGVTTDIDSPNYNGGSLTVHFSANGAAEDQLSILTDGSVTVAAGVVSVGGNAVGTVAGGANGADLVVSFNNTGNATPASISTLIEHIAYADNSDNPSTAARTVNFAVDDGDGGTSTGSANATINITAVNDSPVVANAGNTVTYAPPAPAVTLDSSLTVSDVDNANLTGATVRISSGQQPGDVLHFTNQNGITGSYDAATGTLTLTGVDTLAHYQTALRTVTFDNLTNANATDHGLTATRTVDWQVNDGTALPGLLFQTHVDYSAGSGARAVVTGDFNNDGKLDLAVANQPDNTITMMLGNGNGTFTTSQTFSLPIPGSSPQSIKAVDLDHDGKLDLVVALDNSNTANWIHGNGDGTLGTVFNIPVGFHQTNVAVADLNSDGLYDLVFANDAQTTVSVVLGTPFVSGFPTFGPATTFTVGSFPESVAIADLNGDNIPDLAVANQSTGNVSILFGNGSGGFGAATNFGVGSTPFSVAAGDIDNDGDIDLAVANRGGSTVSILLNNGAGSFVAGASVPVGSNPISVVLADLNGDGKLDVAAANLNSGNITEALGLGNGLFGSSINFLTGTNPINVAVGDFDRINGPDLAVANQGSANVSVLLNNANNLSALQHTNINLDIPPVIDLDGDNSSGAAGANYTTTFTENGAAVALADTDASVSDADTTLLSSATITITNFQAGEDVLAFTANGSTGDIAINSNAGGVLTLTSAAGATFAQWQAALHAVTYANTSDNPNTADRLINVNVSDGLTTSNTAVATVHITAVNDAPAATAGGTASYTEQTAAVVVDNTVTVSDVDSANLAGATVTISSGLQSGDTLHFTNQNGISFVSYIGGVLTLSGSSSVANYQTALRSVTFDNTTSDNPTVFGTVPSRTVTWQVDDGGGAGNQNLSNTPTSTINITAVNDAPVATAGGTSSYTEQTAAVAVDNTVTVSDIDSQTLAGATVTISSGLQTGDTLHFTDQNGISFVSYTGGVLTLSGTATLAQYQTALRSVTFDNTTNDNPTVFGTVLSRTVTWQVDDGSGSGNQNLSNTPTSTINLTAVNDAPAVDLNGATAGTGVTLNYTENAAATAIAPAGVTTDVDSADFNGGSLTVHFSANGAAEDQLSVLATGGVTVVAGVVSVGGNAVGTVSGGANGADLVISFNTNNATPAAITTLLEHIGYADNSDDPSTAARSVSFTLVDGDGGTDTGSATATINITAVNDAPGLTNVPATGDYTENAAAVTTGTEHLDHRPGSVPARRARRQWPHPHGHRQDRLGFRRRRPAACGRHERCAWAADPRLLHRHQRPVEL